MKPAFVPKNGSLKVIVEDAEIVTLYLTDNGMLLYHGIEENYEEDNDYVYLLQKKETN